MNKTLKLILIITINILDILVIAAQIYVTGVNFSLFPRASTEGMFMGMMMIFHPIAAAVIALLLCLNFILRDMRQSGNLLLISILFHLQLMLVTTTITNRFQYTPLFFKAVNITVVIAICIFILLIFKLIKVCYKTIKREGN